MKNLIASLFICLASVASAEIIKTESGGFSVTLYTGEDIECYDAEGRTFREEADRLGLNISSSGVGPHYDGELWVWMQVIDGEGYADSTMGMGIGFNEHGEFCILNKAYKDKPA
jgi:hypothetical protein